MSRNLFIIGNWKMNPSTLSEAKEIYTDIKKVASRSPNVHVVVAPPAPFIFSLGNTKSSVALAIQDVGKDVGGSHTGEVSAKMAKSVGARFAIVGHSERRALGDSDEIVAEKFIRIIEAGLVPILCVGEKKRDQDGDYFSEISREISIVLKAIPKTKSFRFIIAYEPVWAVGGSYDNALSPEDMRAMAIFIKKTCSNFMSKEKAMKIPVLYGGSVDADNAQTMLSDGGIDGLLVGRVSLDSRHFSEIIRFADGR